MPVAQQYECLRNHCWLWALLGIIVVMQGPMQSSTYVVDDADALDVASAKSQ
jgi:hypothetical protein